MMTHVFAALICMMGAFLMLASLQMNRLVHAHHISDTEAHAYAWFVRLFGFFLAMLGVATLFYR